MLRIKLKIGDVIAGEEGKEFRTFRIQSRLYLAYGVNETNVRLCLTFSEAQRLAEHGMLDVRPGFSVPSAREIQEARHRRVACETLLALIAEGEAERNLQSVSLSMPKIRRAWLHFMLNDRAYDRRVEKPFLRPASPAAVFGWLASYDGTDASQMPASAAVGRWNPLEGFDGLVVAAVREAAAVRLTGASLSCAYQLMDVFVRDSGGAPSTPRPHTFRRAVECLVYAWAGRHAPMTMPEEPERWDAVTKSSVPPRMRHAA